MTPADLRNTRSLLGLSQRALAERLGIPQATVSRWETGKHRIERPKTLALALWALRWQSLVPSNTEPGDVLFASWQPL